jgi:tRNA threonylcarbamoyladenosine biosynthesis protein TsaE
MASAARTLALLAVDCTDEQVTERLGHACANALRALERGPVLIALSGELGAGKTTLVRAILRGLGYCGAVPSPTYTLLEQYEVGGWSVAHLDFYRLGSAADLENLGVRELLGGRRLMLVEWPEHVAGGLPAADVTVLIALEAGSRRVQLRAETGPGDALLAAVARQITCQIVTVS